MLLPDTDYSYGPPPPQDHGDPLPALTRIRRGAAATSSQDQFAGDSGGGSGAPSSPPPPPQPPPSSTSPQAPQQQQDSGPPVMPTQPASQDDMSRGYGVQPGAPQPPPQKPPIQTPSMQALSGLQRPARPHNNWLQTVGQTVLGMNPRLGPGGAEAIMHPQYAQQMAAYQGQEQDLEQRAKLEEAQARIGYYGEFGQGRVEAQKARVAEQAQAAQQAAQDREATLKLHNAQWVQGMISARAHQLGPNDQPPAGTEVVTNPLDNTRWAVPPAAKAMELPLPNDVADRYHLQHGQPIPFEAWNGYMNHAATFDAAAERQREQQQFMAQQNTMNRQNRLDMANLTHQPTAIGQPEFDNITRQTSTGYKYIDGTGYSGKDFRGLQQAAAQNQMRVLPKDQVDAIQNIETARQNVDFMLSQLTSKLPKDAAGRILVGPANKIGQYLQTDDILAAAGTYRTAAIQLMRAAAGSKGLRINQAEIQASQQNDIPLATDTIATAMRKSSNMRTMLAHQEQAILGHQQNQPQQVHHDPIGIR